MNQAENSELLEKLDLYISCRQLDDLDIVSDLDPYAVIYLKHNNHWTKFGQTELVKNNLNPNYKTSIQLEYHFEVQQHLKLEVYHYISPTQSKVKYLSRLQVVGIAETTVALIVASRDQILMGDLINISGRRSGYFIIQADIIKQIKDEIILTLSAHDIKETRFLFWHGTCPQLRFYRYIMDDNNPVLIHETEFAKKTTQPKWNEINFSSFKLCGGDHQMNIKVELWDHRNNGKHLYLGETTFCVDELIEHKKWNRILEKEFMSKTNGKESSGVLQFNGFQFNPNYTLLEYCRGGLQLKLITAIDFAASNGNFNDPNSLHYMKSNGAQSQYLQAITSLMEILICYDKDKSVPVYGFGCKPKMNLINTNKTLSSFALNDNPKDPEVIGLDGIVQCYIKQLPHLCFDGPAKLTPSLKIAMDMAHQLKLQDSDKYQILLIFTNGQVGDMKEFINEVNAQQNLPLSIIIIGIGDGNFDELSALNNQVKNIVDSDGNYASRDLLKFVPFNQLKNDLARQVLPQINKQLLQYMKVMSKSPKPINHKNLFNLKQTRQYPQPQPCVSQEQKFPSQLLYAPQLSFPPQISYPNQAQPLQTDFVLNQQAFINQGFQQGLVQQRNQYPQQ
ncbi:unnamed protein product (macronuclear) [Paramecium tetraurelia]|uniref:C2 domain-containing protein n=1 Tax=Paramecium tetraurelia TaxID=5888 RepID=A0CX82_PARTE|nr:uncharacterized protein GSPATT00001603001 [Paramecium tetraurelia]CAK75399.1 unnamed protein product [Paramecium tetraurelia]|eukprot:XP_001442796.1 hypothetical protein (macronuclear) [Paramecium tetraurelia strain d4-2]